MINVKKITDIIEKFAPLELAENWDNTGWQINSGKTKVNNILVCLTVTQDVMKQATDNNCDFIISHHPLIFNGIKNINLDNTTQKIIAQCIKNDIQVYCAHTNLDCTKNGVGDVLCKALKLKPTKTVDKFVKISHLDEPISLDDFITRIKIALNTEKVKLINPNNIKNIKKIAICGGSGSEFISKLSDIDLFITGDIKYHNALDTDSFAIIDAGHFSTEKIIVETLKKLLIKEAPNLIIAKEKEPWITV